MLFASRGLARRRSSPRSPPSRAREAPPVAVLATKSSVPPSATVLRLRQARGRREGVDALEPPPPQPAASSEDERDAARTIASRRVSVRVAPVATQRTAIVPRRAAADERLERYARLAVQVGLNLQPGQTLGDQRA